MCKLNTLRVLKYQRDREFDPNPTQIVIFTIFKFNSTLHYHPKHCVFSSPYDNAT